MFFIFFRRQVNKYERRKIIFSCVVAKQKFVHFHEFIFRQRPEKNFQFKLLKSFLFFHQQTFRQNITLSTHTLERTFSHLPFKCGKPEKLTTCCRTACRFSFFFVPKRNCLELLLPHCHVLCVLIQKATEWKEGIRFDSHPGDASHSTGCFIIYTKWIQEKLCRQ